MQFSTSGRRMGESTFSSFLLNKHRDTEVTETNKDASRLWTDHPAAARLPRLTKEGSSRARVRTTLVGITYSSSIISRISRRRTDRRLRQPVD
jgi:hypothetical protein